ncbi:hypothetical protein AAFF_G00197240 [Aldrovandia affinis]|uniref:Small nuclear ribonucleoprotein Sm D3 n=1 Tax=Aldrovandia affinis TaxID=143900 RepID=A0AAD7RIM9_9TELE|nr:hypothetical protein AAFF_G00197240 [Aldrovandia affinis]
MPMLGWNKCAVPTNSTCPPGTTHCLFEEVVTMDYTVYFNFFACMLAPLLAMLGIYLCIFMVARRQLCLMGVKTWHRVGSGVGPGQGLGVGQGAGSRSTLQREIHAAISLAIIVGLFAVCCFTLFCPHCPCPCPPTTPSEPRSRKKNHWDHDECPLPKCIVGGGKRTKPARDFTRLCFGVAAITTTTVLLSKKAGKMSIGVPIKVLHEAEGHIVTCETNTGEVYRGKLIEAEDNMNCQMSNITVTFRDGRVSQLEQVYIRGSKIRFLILPDMLKNAPMLKSMKNKNQGSGAGRGKAAILKAQVAARGRGRGGMGRGNIFQKRR